MATVGAPSETAGLFSKLKDGVSTAGKRVSEMELDKKLAPMVEQGKQVAGSGWKVADQARETLTSERLWERQHALVGQLVGVLTLQQGLIEELRARVATLEGAR